MSDLREKLRILGIEVSAGLLRQWASKGLIPGPQLVPHASGRGQTGEWPPEAVEQAAAAWRLLRLERCRVAEVRKARQLALKIFQSGNMARGLEAAYKEHGPQTGLAAVRGRMPRCLFLSTYFWISTVAKVRLGLDVLRPAMLSFKQAGRGPDFCLPKSKRTGRKMLLQPYDCLFAEPVASRR